MIWVPGLRHVKANVIGKTKAGLESVCGISDGAVKLAVEYRSCRRHLEYRTGQRRERLHTVGPSLNKSGEGVTQIYSRTINRLMRLLCYSSWFTVPRAACNSEFRLWSIEQTQFCIQVLRLSCNVLSQSKFIRSKTS
jgi:hypothetical protein